MVLWLDGSREIIPDEDFAMTFVPQILYEDNHLLLVVKPAGILSQEDISGDPDMLSLLKKDIAIRYHKPGNVFLGLIHRLDRPVSGVMVFAKTGKAASRLSAQVREGRFDKRYRAVVVGTPTKSEDELVHYLSKDHETNVTTVYAVTDTAPKDAKLARLRYRKLGEYSGGAEAMSLLEVELLTGRSHQIRAQLSYMGCPIIGDNKYGAKEMFRSGKKADIALEAYQLSFDHPVSKERLTFSLPLPSALPWSLFGNGENNILGEGG